MYHTESEHGAIATLLTYPLYAVSMSIQAAECYLALNQSHCAK